MGFFKKFGIAQLKDAKRSIEKALVEFDPEAATEAAIEIMEDNLGTIVSELASARQSYNKEAKEAAAARDTYNKLSTVASKLADKQAHTVDEVKSKEIGEALDAVVSKIEGMVGDVKVEIAEEEAAKEIVDDLTALVASATDKLKGARRQHKEAMNEMAKADMAKRRAEANESRAKRSAGLADDSGMDVAINAMQAAASERTAAAEAATIKADILETTGPKVGNSMVDELMAEMDNPDAGKSTADRLKGLPSF